MISDKQDSEKQVIFVQTHKVHIEQRQFEIKNINEAYSIVNTLKTQIAHRQQQLKPKIDGKGPTLQVLTSQPPSPQSTKNLHSSVDHLSSPTSGNSPKPISLNPAQKQLFTDETQFSFTKEYGLVLGILLLGFVWLVGRKLKGFLKPVERNKFQLIEYLEEENAEFPHQQEQYVQEDS